MQKLKEFLSGAYTAYHATELAEQALCENGFVKLSETDDWELKEG